jgi:hypothetical protein
MLYVFTPLCLGGVRLRSGGNSLLVSLLPDTNVCVRMCVGVFVMFVCVL